MKDFDYSYLMDALECDPNEATIAETILVLHTLVKECSRLQSLLYLSPKDVKEHGRYRMYRTDDFDNDGILCEIAQSCDNFYLLGDGVPSDITCQNILTLDPEVRFLKV